MDIRLLQSIFRMIQGKKNEWYSDDLRLRRLAVQEIIRHKAPPLVNSHVSLLRQTRLENATWDGQQKRRAT